MSEFTVHTIPGSPFSRAVMATLEEKQAKWQLAALAPGELKREPHLGRHAFGRMPVLEHGDFTIYETQAILRYLDRVLHFPALTPSDPRAAGRMDQVMGISDWYVYLGCGNVITFQRVVGPRVLGLTPDESLIAEAMPRAHLAFAELSRLLGSCPWMAGDQFSLADLILAPQIEFFARTPEWEQLTAERDNLMGWLERVEARPSFRATTWERVAEIAEGG